MKALWAFGSDPFGRSGTLLFLAGRGSTILATNPWTSSSHPFSPMLNFLVTLFYSVKALWAFGSDPFGRSGTLLFLAGRGSTILATNPWTSSSHPFSPMLHFLVTLFYSVKALWAFGLDPFGRSGTLLFLAGSGSTILATNPWTSSSHPFSPILHFLFYTNALCDFGFDPFGSGGFDECSGSFPLGTLLYTNLYTSEFIFAGPTFFCSVKALWAFGSDPFGRSGTSLFGAGRGPTIFATNPWTSASTPFSPIFGFFVEIGEVVWVKVYWTGVFESAI